MLLTPGRASDKPRKELLFFFPMEIQSSQMLASMDPSKMISAMCLVYAQANGGAARLSISACALAGQPHCCHHGSSGKSLKLLQTLQGRSWEIASSDCVL